VGASEHPVFLCARGQLLVDTGFGEGGNGSFRRFRDGTAGNAGELLASCPASEAHRRLLLCDHLAEPALGTDADLRCVNLPELIGAAGALLN
jgi:hypothetical protein